MRAILLRTQVPYCYCNGLNGSFGEERANAIYITYRQSVPCSKYTFLGQTRSWHIHNSEIDPRTEMIMIENETNQIIYHDYRIV